MGYSVVSSKISKVYVRDVIHLLTGQVEGSIEVVISFDEEPCYDTIEEIIEDEVVSKLGGYYATV